MQKKYLLVVALLAYLLVHLEVKAGSPAYRLEIIAGPASSQVRASLPSELQTQGIRLLNGTGTPVCELWLRKLIPGRAASAPADVLYGSLREGTWMGILHFPQSGSDFRGQSIKSGFYSLRYARIPQDGNHMGVSLYRDFLLLTPLEADKQAQEFLSFDDMITLSLQASGTNHPVVLSLAPPPQRAALKQPALLQNDLGYWVLESESSVQPEGSAQASPLPLAIVLVGKAEA